MYDVVELMVSYGSAGAPLTWEAVRTSCVNLFATRLYYYNNTNIIIIIIIIIIIVTIIIVTIIIITIISNQRFQSKKDKNYHLNTHFYAF